MLNENRNPLTLEQLRDMDGEVVLIGDSNGIIAEKAFVRAERGFLSGQDRTKYYFECLGKTYFAYAYPPAHIDREAWEPCGACKSCGNCEESRKATREKINYNHPCHSCLGYDNFKPVAFCRRCGRPLTEKAWAELEKRLRR